MAEGRIRRSEKISNYVKVIMAIQAAMKKAVKKADNPYFKSKYATLEIVNDCLQAAMEESKEQLLIQQFPSTLYLGHATEQGKSTPILTVTTRITEPKSGEWEELDMDCQPVEDKPQAIGSAITYLRRYSLVSIFNISTEDDDGNAGSGIDPMDQRSHGDRRPPSKPLARTADLRPGSQVPPPARGNDSASTVGAGKPVESKNQAPVNQPTPEKPLPTTQQVNTALKQGGKGMTDKQREAAGLIVKKYIDEITVALVSKKITPEKWKLWLEEVYGYPSVYAINVDAYAGILKTVNEMPEQIINYKGKQK